ncbi:MAG: TM0996/MTH895 family glutaredoxin-like protein [Ignavibacteriae bacterium]|nr:TM0996/MTH895 family glutaredoxin-like protein [Ignavibacteriota bacterium]
MNIKVLGTGCPKCKTLYQRVEQLVAANGFDVTLEKVERIEDIISYGVMMTPSLVVDGSVKSSGRLPTDAEILSWVTTALAKG